MGTPIVFEAEIVNPSACWCLSRIPRARSYRTVIVCAHQPGTSCPP